MSASSWSPPTTPGSCRSPSAWSGYCRISAQSTASPKPAGGKRFGVVRAGQHGDLIYVVVDGELEVVRESADGAEQLLKIATPGEYVGEIGPLFHMARSATVRARTDAIVTGYTVQPFHRLLEAYAERSLIDHRDLGGAALLTGHR